MRLGAARQNVPSLLVGDVCRQNVLDGSRDPSYGPDDTILAARPIFAS